MPNETNAVTPRKISIVFGLIIISALIVRIVGIWKGIWLDEAASLFYVDSTLPELIGKLSLGNAPPLYYLVLKGWISVFGASEISIRFPSMISTLGGLAVMYHVLKKYGPVSGLAGAVLIAFSPLSIYYSQEARNYALLFFVLSLYIYCYMGFIREIRKKPYLSGLVVCSFLICLTHNIGFFFIAGMQISLLLVKTRRLRTLWFLGHVVLLAVLSPWLIVLLKQASRVFTLAWFLPIWESKSILAHFYSTFSLFCVGPYPPYMAISTFSNTIAAIISIPFFLIAVYGYAEHRKDMALNGLFLGSGLAVLLLFVFSIMKQPIYIPGRSDYFLYPVYVIFLALGTSALKFKYAPPLLMAAVLAASFSVLIPYYGDDVKNGSRKYAGRIADGLNNGDMLITTGLTYLVPKYYLDRWGKNLSIVTYPESTIRHPGYFFENEHIGNISKLTDYSKKILASVKAARAGRKKAYLVLTPHKTNDILLKVLSTELNFKKIHKTKFHQSLTGTPVKILSLEEKKKT